MSTHQSLTPLLGRRGSRVAVVGCGLIGGSIALGIKRGRSRPTVLGVDRRAVLARARERGAIDEATSVRGLLSRLESEPVHLIVLAIPVDDILELLPALAEASRRLSRKQRPLILDVASVKRVVVDAARACDCPRFIGGHPMAGTQHSGMNNARADMLRGATFALCRGTGSQDDLRLARAFVERLGAVPRVVDAAQHDRAVATTSHLPHLAAWALMDTATHSQERLGRHERLWELAGGSWQDVTRVAASDPRLWNRILHHNREAVLESLDTLLACLTRIRAGLESGADVLSDEAQGVAGAKLSRIARRMSARAED